MWNLRRWKRTPNRSGLMKLTLFTPNQGRDCVNDPCHEAFQVAGNYGVLIDLIHPRSSIPDTNSAPLNTEHAGVVERGVCLYVWEGQSDWWLLTEVRKSPKLKWPRAIRLTSLSPMSLCVEWKCLSLSSFFFSFFFTGCQNNKTEKKNCAKFIGTSGTHVMEWHSLIVTWYLMTSAGSSPLHFPFGRKLCHLRT